MYVVQEPAFLFRDRVRNIPTYLPTSTSPSPFAFQEPYAQRLSPISQQSISSGLSQTSGSTSKRSLDQSSSDPISSSKRRRSSTATALDGDVDVNMRPPPIVTLPPPSSSSTRSASVSSSTSVTPTSEHPGQGSQVGSQPRQTLLSPSQKRANHIQSEQKRRANIRRGYEALCDVVPALREAIKAEECASNVPGMYSKDFTSSNLGSY